MKEILSEKILKALSGDNNKKHSLEELAEIIYPAQGNFFSGPDAIEAERRIQADLLDALLELEEQQLIVLDEDTDQSMLARQVYKLRETGTV
ncbi:hypothetical protein [Flavobacterium sp. UW10123]|uniref:hypothetical protein n=1 Tax=Flavobacterium sp. UW10123 TaxID=3230800 RepID=UPI0025CE57F8|nr:hypothetical protein [uncultured Flavobacterium sp.]